MSDLVIYALGDYKIMRFFIGEQPTKFSLCIFNNL